MDFEPRRGKGHGVKMFNSAFIVVNADGITVRIFTTRSAAQRWIAAAGQDYEIERFAMNDNSHSEAD